ncbi:MAG TPA: hypothetical protein VKX45_11345 [Bryobacteraceae bacterium]|jgi:hypothetical protein|nr:hypothetical protein [Bryobacteraceae bacterium]
MNRDLQEIKAGLAQVRATLVLLEQFIAEYEARTVNILPAEDVQFYRASDDEVIEGAGIGEVTSLNQTIREAAQQLVPQQLPTA